MSYLINPFVRLFDFRTRSSRCEYWLFLVWMLPFYVVAAALTAFAGTAAVFNDSGSSEAIQTASTMSTIAGIIFALFILPLPALTVRRMHDTGGTGWLLFVPAYGVIRAAFFPGSAGSNRFGNPPTR